MADDDPDLGRGVIWIDQGEGETLTLCHAENGARFPFLRTDLDEVIGMLATLRMMLEAAEGVDEESNGLG